MGKAQFAPSAGWVVGSTPTIVAIALAAGALTCHLIVDALASNRKETGMDYRSDRPTRSIVKAMCKLGAAVSSNLAAGTVAALTRQS